MNIGVVGAGAFGTGLAISLISTGQKVTLWGRDAEQMKMAEQTRENSARLPNISLPEGLNLTSNIGDLAETDTILMSIPMQQLTGFTSENRGALNGKNLVACCKGIDLKQRVGPSSILAKLCPDSAVAVLTGPSFAVDIARGMPTALTLACANEAVGISLQQSLTTPN
ncbi:MAG: NAD(P)-binding domain-containing protein, partial [Paracoccaceae bacterium]|nr:NAD(P)-binding domain-containing protein [Paracoccaceae bacterium]